MLQMVEQGFKFKDPSMVL